MKWIWRQEIPIGLNSDQLEVFLEFRGKVKAAGIATALAVWTLFYFFKDRPIFKAMDSDMFFVFRFVITLLVALIAMETAKRLLMKSTRYNDAFEVD